MLGHRKEAQKHPRHIKMMFNVPLTIQGWLLLQQASTAQVKLSIIVKQNGAGEHCCGCKLPDTA